MILTIDIGNSNICFGVYEGKTPLFTARAKTDPLRSETEYAVLLSQIFALHRFDAARLTGAAISSVVPALTTVFSDAVRILGEIPTIVVGPGVKTGLNIRIDEPAPLGADLACTAVGAAEKYPLPAIIIDNGRLMAKNMEKMGLNDKWLQKQLKANGVRRVEDVFLMTADRNGSVVLAKKEAVK